MGNPAILVIGFLTEVVPKWIVKLAIAAVLSAASRKLFKPKAPATTLQDRTVTVIEPLASRKIIYGEARVGGTIVYVDTTHDNSALHLVIAFAGHEVSWFKEIYFEDTPITWNRTTGFITGPAQYMGTTYPTARIFVHNGSDSQEADPYLMADSPQWTVDHRLRGIAYAYIRLAYYPDVFPNGIPNITAVILGKKILNPISGERYWSPNSVACLADYLMDTRYGLHIPKEKIHLPTWNSFAQICNQLVPLADGTTEARYRCNGVIDSADDPGTIIQQLASSAGAPTVTMMGMWYVYAGAYKIPIYSFDEGDFAGSLKVQTKVPRSVLFNHVKGTYVNPVNEWQPADYPVVTSTAYTIEDGGETIWHEYDLPMTTSPSMAQRLALLELNKTRRQITVTGTFKLKALGVIPADNVYLSIDRLGWVNKVFEVIDWNFSNENDMSLAVQMTLRETDSAVYAWSTADESAAHASAETNLPNFNMVQAPTGLSATSQNVLTGSGSDETYTVLLQWTQPPDFFVVNGGLIQVQYKENSSPDWLPSWFVSGSLTQTVINMLDATETYDFRVRSFNYLAYSGWVTVTGVTIHTTIGATTFQDWGDWTSAPSAFQEWGNWTSAPSTTDDWGTWV